MRIALQSKFRSEGGHYCPCGNFNNWKPIATFYANSHFSTIICLHFLFFWGVGGGGANLIIDRKHGPNHLSLVETNLYVT